MTTFQEGDLEISFSGVKSAWKFDDASHALSHCMKAVDFVVEPDDEYIFIEIKDPENPNAHVSTVAQWISDFQTGKINDELTHKFRDSFIYEWASGRADKPVSFFVLIAISTQHPITGQHAVMLGPKTSDLRRKLPSGIPPDAGWVKPVAHDGRIFNINSWNTNLPSFLVKRLSTGSTTQ